MSDLIDAIIQTRKTAIEIAEKSLVNINGISEVELREKIISETKNHQELFSLGWYDPPPAGISVLFAQKPFKRLFFNSLRNLVYWPKEDSLFQKESLGMIYLSPVDRKTGMIGDIAFTIYNGKDEEIKKHIKKCYDVLLLIAQHVEVGMKFSDFYKFALNSFKNEIKLIGEMTTNSDPNLGINLGHTIPGSFEDNFVFGNTFEEIKDVIRTKRIYINEVENFKVPETCAFTVEVRLQDQSKPELPKVYFHFIVCFDKGKKIILNNYDSIFNMVGMDYMNSNK